MVICAESKGSEQGSKDMLPRLTGATTGYVTLGESPDLSKWDHTSPAGHEDQVIAHI